MLSRLVAPFLLCLLFAVSCNGRHANSTVVIDSLSITPDDTAKILRVVYRIDHRSGELQSSSVVLRIDTSVVITSEFNRGYISRRKYFDKRHKVVHVLDYSHFYPEEYGLYSIDGGGVIPNGDHINYFPCSDYPKTVIPFRSGKINGVGVEYESPGIVARKVYYRDNKSFGSFIPSTNKVIGDTVLSR